MTFRNVLDRQPIHRIIGRKIVFIESGDPKTKFSCMLTKQGFGAICMTRDEATALRDALNELLQPQREPEKTT